jgi:hypothetical protein
METNTYPFSLIKDFIVGNYSISDWFSFTIYSHKAPSVGDKIEIENKIYEVDSVIDDTDDEEYEQGLSYSNVSVCLIDSDAE